MAAAANIIDMERKSTEQESGVFVRYSAEDHLTRVPGFPSGL